MQNRNFNQQQLQQLQQQQYVNNRFMPNVNSAVDQKQIRQNIPQNMNVQSNENPFVCELRNNFNSNDENKMEVIGEQIFYYLKNLPKELSDRDLFEIFREYGEITKAIIPTEGKFHTKRDEKGEVVDKEFIYESKGFGFVCFKKTESAESVILHIKSGYQ